MNKNELLRKILSSYKVEVEDIIESRSNTVTLYEVKPVFGVRVSKIRNLKDDIAVHMGVKSVRIVAPLSNGYVGIEIPNEQRDFIPVSELLTSPLYLNNGMELPVIMGRTTENELFMRDLTEMPHLLVAGATGQGKSVGLNVILSSLINARKPEELKIVLIDPKQVEFSVYNELTPYLAKLSYMSDPVITEAEDAQNALEAVCRIMDERYSLLKSEHVRNIQEYNLKTNRKLPYYVVVIDEYGDLVMTADGSDMEKYICRIAQKARAVGIHMIISTQRPSATIVTGNIKANFPTRIAFRTTTGTDSRVVLDRVGAEKLTGKGDMLFFFGAEVTRVQCAYISTEEVMGMCKEIKDKYDNPVTILPEPPRKRRNTLFKVRATLNIIDKLIKMHTFSLDELKRVVDDYNGHESYAYANILYQLIGLELVYYNQPERMLTMLTDDVEEAKDIIQYSLDNY